MKYFLGFLGLLVILLGVIYFVPSLHAKATALLSFSTCDTPMPYKLGNVDTRFGLTNQQILSDLGEAGNVWSQAEGKKLFTYSPTANLAINFVYDQRQALDTSINSLNSQLKQNSDALDQQIAQYKADVAAYEQKLSDFNATVDRYNSQGGAPPDVYKDLKQQQQQLNAEGDALNERAQQLHLATNDYNSNVANLNNDIAQFNNTLKQKPEEGIYDGANNTITIYIYDTQQDLLHTLTHEFGHALGMVHVSDPHAIMYPYTTPSLAVTPQDMDQLKYACREQSILLYNVQAASVWLNTEINNIHQSLQK